MLGETQEKGRERTTQGSGYRAPMTDPDGLTVDHFQERGAFAWPRPGSTFQVQGGAGVWPRDIEEPRPAPAATEDTLHHAACFGERRTRNGVWGWHPRTRVHRRQLCAHDRMFPTERSGLNLRSLLSGSTHAALCGWLSAFARVCGWCRIPKDAGGWRDSACLFPSRGSLSTSFSDPNRPLLAQSAPAVRGMLWIVVMFHR